MPRRGRRRAPIKMLAGSTGPAKTNTGTAAQRRSMDGCSARPNSANRPRHGKRRNAEDGRNTQPNKRLAASNQNSVQVARSAPSAQPLALVASSASSHTSPEHAMLAFLLRRKAKNALTPAQATALKNLPEGVAESVSPPSPRKKPRLD